MKRKILSLSLTLILGLLSWSASAATGWFSDYIKLDVNGAGVTPPTGWYWIGSDPSYATQLEGANLGTVTSLILDGADMKYWSDTQDRTGSSFFYRIMSSDGLTEIVAPVETVLSQTGPTDNNYQGTASGLNINLLSAALNPGTTYKLQVYAKSWGTGQGDSWLSNSGANYTATFTTPAVMVSGSASQDGFYSTLGAAITAIETNQSGNNISVKIGASTTESSTVTIGNGDWSSLRIYPIASGLTSSSVFISLNGAKNVTIDGRVNQTGSPTVADNTCLTLTSTSVTNPVISFDSDAQSNTVLYCNIKIGALPNTTGGIVFGATAATPNGNGNNLINRNLITSSGATYPTYSIYASGNASNPNKGNQITNNEFTNFMAAGSAAIGILVLGNAGGNINDNYTISGNSMYGNLTTNSGGNRVFIQIGAGGNGGSHSVTGNYIGGRSAQCGGLKMVKSGSVVSNFQGIVITTSNTGTTLVQNNTIQNIDWNASSGQTTAQNFTAISVSGSGNATISGNVIGNNTTSASDGTTASIVSSVYNTTNSSVNGISISTTGTVLCEDNQIGSIYAINNNTAASTVISFNGINKTAAAGTTTIRNNTIGSLTAPLSINHTSTNTTPPASQNVFAITISGTGQTTVNNNAIANISNRTSTGYTYGINMNGGAASTGIVNGNLVHSITTTGYTGTGAVVGILAQTGTNTITNNVLRLGDNNAVDLRGISESTNAVTTNVYQNTVYLSGSPTSGAFNSGCLVSAATSSVKNYKNNIFVNTRSNNGASGSNYAININTGGTHDINFNNYLVTGIGGVLGRFGSDKTSLPIITSNDANSISINPLFANAGGTTPESYVPSSLSLTGVDLSATVTADYSGVTRTTTPTMGAHDYRIWNGTAWNTAPTADYNAKIDGNFTGAGFASSNLVVNAGKQLDVTSGTLAVGNNLTILSDAANGTGTLTYSGLTIGGTTTVQQYLPHARNWYVSSPVSGAVAPAGYTYYQRDEAGASWTTQPFVSGNTFTPGKGYIALPGSAASTITFSGTLNDGNVSIPLTWSGAASKGFNLIGNPYPSHLSWTEAFVEAVTAPEGGTAPATLIEPSIYVRTNAGTVNNSGQWSFQTYNASTGLAVPSHSLLSSGIIPPMQAFWVKAKVAGNLILTNALTKSHQSGNPLKAPALKNTDRQLIRLEVSNGTKTDETLLFFDSDAENTYDRYDSPKFAEANTEMQIYTSVETEKLVMNGLKTMPLNQEIALGFVPGSASAFSIKATEITNLPSDVSVILIDNAMNGMETDLTDGTASYQFSTSESTTTDRFTLLFRAPDVSTQIDNTIKLNAQVFVNSSNQITIIAPEKCTYAIYNAVGQMIGKGITNENTTVVDLNSSNKGNGFFVVKVSDTEKELSAKVFIK
jgi:hypothetical protein